VLFHLGLRVARNPGAAATDTDDVAALFGRVTHAVLCGSASRARALAAAFADDAAGGVTDVTRTDRYALFLSAGGRVAVASHGIGRPSVGIVLHELTKLFRYARAGGVDGATAAASAATAALPPVTYYRVGTCGGVGVEAGTLVLTRNVVDGRLRGEVGTTVLGVSRTEAAVLDPATVASLTAYARGVVGGKAPPPPSLGDGGGAGRCGGGDPTAHARHCAALHQVVVGTTATLDGFYEEQGRMDGASCSFDEAQRAAWLRHAHEAGVNNFEVRTKGGGAGGLRRAGRVALGRGQLAVAHSVSGRLRGRRWGSGRAGLALLLVVSSAPHVLTCLLCSFFSRSAPHVVSWLAFLRP